MAVRDEVWADSNTQQRYSCGAYIEWGEDVEHCYMTVCPGMRYTVFAGDRCDD
jgi:hypothetical protein